jgi:hypothetical protein
MKKTTWFALGAFVLLLIGFLISQNIESAPEATPVPTEQPALRALDDQDIAQILYTDATGVTIELDKAEALSWTSPTHPEAQVTAGKIEELLANLSGLSIISTLPADTTLADLGLDAPIYTISFVLEDEATYRIAIGGPTAMLDGYYAWIDESEIVVLPTTTMEYLPTLMYTIVTPPTATPDPEAVPSLTPTP